MRSTLRRNAMATPASVHCVSLQLVFCNLSCTGLRRKVWHSRHHCLVTIHIVSHWIERSSCSSWNFWICILRSCGFGPCRQPSEGRLSESSDSGIATIYFPVGFKKMLYTLFSLYATVQPRYCESLISFWIHASIFFATVEPLWNM